MSLTTTSCGDGFLEIEYPNIIEESFIFQNEDNVLSGLNGIYDALLTNGDLGGDGGTWGFKPQILMASYPVLDCLASGWDNEMCRHEWRADKDMFKNGWQVAYYAISRANQFLAGLETADTSIFKNPNDKSIIEAEARALRAYNYLFLVKSFGGVPMLLTGETYSSSPSKERSTIEEAHALIIEDLSFAANTLEWTPYRGEYGRATKGMAKAYIAEVYLYQEKFAEAKTLYEEIINSGVYALQPCFGKIYDLENAWCSEDVWCIGYPAFSNMGWGAMNTAQVSMWYAYMCDVVDGWGSMFVSYEFCNSFESGDKRRQYSVVERGQTHPISGQVVPTDSTKTAEKMPYNGSLKWWRIKAGSNNIIFEPISLHVLRYAEILLNYAECCFETGDAAKGWDLIAQIRNRAWGNLEVGGSDVNGVFEFNTEVVDVPDAQTFYNSYKRDAYTAEPWLVALSIERRHEFNAEFSIFQSYTRTGIMEQYLNAEYPLGKAPANTPRQFTWDPNHAIFPIPTQEFLTNKALDINAKGDPKIGQNPGY
ncbi:MAG: RagB/SusD family nutrient uptake outer membrane protein [Prevotellaceae bacterium]|jgi:tetratricopeptide (TPR) repeat protein|nr:RagB/SusD family nutrient uptake outer membrane protein [Prevotellaceae bacterium]